jgi:hypothetical protein
MDDIPGIGGRREPKLTSARRGARQIQLPRSQWAGPSANIELGLPMPDLDARLEFATIATDQARKTTLPKQPKAFLFIGRGRTGKTTNIRYLITEMDRKGAAFAVLDADTTNPVLEQYVELASRPPGYDDETLTAWMTDCVFSAIGEKSHLLIDLGGSDRTLRGVLNSVPDFVSVVETMGGAVIACCTLGSSADDLAPLANLHRAGFRPTATVLLFNEASLGSTEVHPGAFASVQSQRFFHELIDNHNAVPLLIPRLKVADTVERRRLDFEFAKSGQSAPGEDPLNFTERVLLRSWMTKMAEVYQPISGWFE